MHPCGWNKILVVYPSRRHLTTPGGATPWSDIIFLAVLPVSHLSQEGRAGVSSRLESCVFNPRSSETHEPCFLRSPHTDLYGFIPCAANALSIKPLSSSFLIRAPVVELIEVHCVDFWILRFHQALHMDHAFGQPTEAACAPRRATGQDSPLGPAAFIFTRRIARCQAGDENWRATDKHL